MPHSILISAGEASGERYGAELIEALRRRDPSLKFFGAGGERMRAAGCELIIDARDLSVVGITEILQHLPKIWGLYGKLITAADRRKPAVAVVIDSPAFNWRVARQMHRRGIPVVYYVCPQFWAWRQGRVKYLRQYVDKALVIFPFEEQFYRGRGVNAEFVGHPLAGLQPPDISREAMARDYSLDASKPWIALMPGSRRKEVSMILPTLLQAAEQLGSEYEYLLPVAPTLDRTWLQSLLKTSRASISLTSNALASLAHARASIVASGTATVEAALMNSPFAMVYRVSNLSWKLGRRLVKLPHFAMVNLIAGREVVPELMQGQLTANNIVGELRKILPEGLARDQMLAGLAEVRQKLGAGVSPGESAADRAAEAVMALMGKQNLTQRH